MARLSSRTATAPMSMKGLVKGLTTLTVCGIFAFGMNVGNIEAAKSPDVLKASVAINDDVDNKSRKKFRLFPPPPPPPPPPPQHHPPHHPRYHPPSARYEPPHPHNNPPPPPRDDRRPSRW